MSETAIEISKMVDMLPESEQNLAYEFIKRIVLAWDPDYTKVTAAERNALDLAENEFEKGETFTHDEINWD